MLYIASHDLFYTWKFVSFDPFHPFHPPTHVSGKVTSNLFPVSMSFFFLISHVSEIT